MAQSKRLKDQASTAKRVATSLNKIIEDFDYSNPVISNLPSLSKNDRNSLLKAVKSLADSGLEIAVIEKQSEAAIASPAFDGREIALTHHSSELMHELGLWRHIDPQAISPLQDARVFNGSSLFSMDIGHRDTQKNELGYLVSNHLIRKAIILCEFHT
jgi:hypothetical protein